MKKIYLFSLVLFILHSHNIIGQNNNTQAALYNIGIGGIFGGVGAVLNKKKNEKTGKVFLKGLWQGATGGYLVYESKKLVYDFSKSGNYGYLWGSKLLNATGNSIIQNAASNERFLSKWYINFGFNRIEIQTKGAFKLKYRVMPIALYGTVISASQGKFDFRKSIKTGTLIFNSNKSNNRGVTYVNSILLESNNIKILAHEIIHSYQYEGFISINSFAINLNERLKNKSSSINKINKWFYFDVHSIFLKGAYELENIGTKSYYDNFFESEANFYSQKIN